MIPLGYYEDCSFVQNSFMDSIFLTSPILSVRNYAQAIWGDSLVNGVCRDIKWLFNESCRDRNMVLQRKFAAEAHKFWERSKDHTSPS